jgi:hypothetical protein
MDISVVDHFKLARGNLYRIAFPSGFIPYVGLSFRIGHRTYRVNAIAMEAPPSRIIEWNAAVYNIYDCILTGSPLIKGQYKVSITSAPPPPRARVCAGPADPGARLQRVPVESPNPNPRSAARGQRRTRRSALPVIPVICRVPGAYSPPPAACGTLGNMSEPPQAHLPGPVAYLAGALCLQQRPPRKSDQAIRPMMKYEERVAARGRREEALGTAERRGGALCLQQRPPRKPDQAIRPMMKYEERVAARGRREEALGTAERRGGA